MKPKRTEDPFVENELKSRIPYYSKVYSKKNRRRELDWVDNFVVKNSKNNDNRHKSFKEYFDYP